MVTINKDDIKIVTAKNKIKWWNLKNVYEDDLLAIYRELASDEHEQKPLFIAGGQFETFLHNKDKYNRLKSYAFKFVRYDKKEFTPYIVVPKYKSLRVDYEDAQKISMQAFLESFKKGVKESGVKEYYMTGHSFGGLLTTMASKDDDKFIKGVAKHAPYFGSVLANIPKLDFFYEKGEFTKQEVLLYKLIKLWIKDKFKFIEEYSHGFTEDFANLGDWNKLTVVGGSIDKETGINIMLKTTWNLMKRLAELEGLNPDNDGFIYWDENMIADNNIDYVKLENANHFHTESKEYQEITNRLLLGVPLK